VVKRIYFKGQKAYKNKTEMERKSQFLNKKKKNEISNADH
jgi:hypothetical protein